MSLQSQTELYRLFTGLSLRLRADISKVTAHERIQHLYLHWGDRYYENIPKNTNKDMQGFKHLKGKLFLER
jgi:hypothetical protein